MKRIIFLLVFLVPALAFAGGWAEGPWAPGWSGGDTRYVKRTNNGSDFSSAATTFGNLKQNASTSATGVVELATDAEAQGLTRTDRAVTPSNLGALAVSDPATLTEVNTGTSTTNGITPKGLFDSMYGLKVVMLPAVGPQTANTTGDGKIYFQFPWAGTWNLVSESSTAISGASEYTAATSGTLTVQVRNVTDGVDMLSTPMTIDATEVSTATAATPFVIDTTHDDVTQGDRIAIDVDVAGDGYGCVVNLVFRKQ